MSSEVSQAQRHSLSVPERLSTGVPAAVVPLMFRLITYSFSAFVCYSLARRLGAATRISVLSGSAGFVVAAAGDRLIVEKRSAKENIPSLKSSLKAPAPSPRKSDSPEDWEVQRLCRKAKRLAESRRDDDKRELETCLRQLNELSQDALTSALRARVGDAIENAEAALTALAKGIAKQNQAGADGLARMDRQLLAALKNLGFAVVEATKESQSLLETVLTTVNHDGFEEVKGPSPEEAKAFYMLETIAEEIIHRPIMVYRADEEFCAHPLHPPRATRFGEAIGKRSLEEGRPSTSRNRGKGKRRSRKPAVSLVYLESEERYVGLANPSPVLMFLDQYGE